MRQETGFGGSLPESESESEVTRVWLFATPQTVAYQALRSMGFSRQEYWSGLPFSWELNSESPMTTHLVLTVPMKILSPGAGFRGEKYKYSLGQVEWLNFFFFLLFKQISAGLPDPSCAGGNFPLEPSYST